MTDRKARDLTEGPVFGHILRLVVPMCFGIAAMMAVGVIDAYWVSRLGTAQLAAVQFVFPVSMAVMSISIGLGAGAVSVVARASGRGDGSRTRRLATDAITLAFLIMVGVSALGIALIDPLFRGMGASEAMMPFIREYMTIWFVGIVFVVGPMVASNILRALGDAILPSLVMVAGALANIVLDPIFIFGLGPIPAMGVAGAATATLIANLLGFFVVLGLLLFREKLIDLSWPGFSEIVWNWREIARIGAPAAGSNLINPASMAVVFAAMARFGEPAVAGFGVANRVEMFAIIPLFALSGSIGPITGQNGGAGLHHRVREAFAKAFLFCAGWGVLMALVLALAGPLLAQLFLPSEDGREIARFYWLAVPITTAGYGVAMAASAGFNGLGRPFYGMALHVLRSVLLMAPLAWIGAGMAGAEGVILGVAAANAVAGAAAAAFVLRFAPMSADEGAMRRPMKPAE